MGSKNGTAEKEVGNSKKVVYFLEGNGICNSKLYLFTSRCSSLTKLSAFHTNTAIYGSSILSLKFLIRWLVSAN